MKRRRMLEEFFANSSVMITLGFRFPTVRVSPRIRGFSRRPCWRAETMKQFCMKIDLISQGKEMTSHENALLLLTYSSTIQAKRSHLRQSKETIRSVQPTENLTFCEFDPKNIRICKRTCHSCGWDISCFWSTFYNGSSLSHFFGISTEEWRFLALSYADSVVSGVQVWNFFLSVIQGSITSHSMVSCGESVIKILATDHSIDRSYTWWIQYTVCNATEGVGKCPTQSVWSKQLMTS